MKSRPPPFMALFNNLKTVTLLLRTFMKNKNRRFAKIKYQITSKSYIHMFVPMTKLNTLYIEKNLIN